MCSLVKVRMTVVVIGAGPAGLYVSIELQKKGKKVIVFEKNSRCGGRMYTDVTKDGKKYETGAWRVKGELAKRLLTAYNCEVGQLRPRPNQEKSVSDVEIVKKSSFFEHFKGNISSFSTSDIFRLHGLKKALSEKGYSGASRKAATSKSYSVGEDDEASKYWYVKEGWTSLIKKMEKEVDVRFDSLFCGFDGKTVEILNRETLVRIPNVEACIVATPPSGFPRDDISLQVLASAVLPLPLCHVWFKTNVKIQHIDFKSTEGPTTQVIANPMQPSDLCQIYVCGEDSTFYLNLSNYSKPALLNFVKTELEKYGMGFTATEIVSTSFWEQAIHVWRPCSSFTSAQNAARKALQPDHVHRPTLFVCGEAFSATMQGWADGALETANAVLRAIGGVEEIPRFLRSKEVAITAVFMGKKIGITNTWLENHPGGEQAILNHRNEDISKLWWILHRQSKIAKANLFHLLLD